jgi:hypothetical protein
MVCFCLSMREARAIGWFLPFIKQQREGATQKIA